MSTAAAKRHMGRAPVAGYEGIYEASSDGGVYSLPRLVGHNYGGMKRWPGRRLKLKAESNGYLRVTLCKDGAKKTEAVHRIVCIAFHGPAPQADLDVNHKNGIKCENSEWNLEWTTRAENELHSYRALGKKNAATMTGRFGAEHNRSVGVEALDLTTGAVMHRYGSMREAERAGFTATRVCACVNGRNASHKGLAWRRADA